MKHIASTRCCGFAAFADKTAVFDSGSSGNTVSLRESAGARIIHRTWSGYADLKYVFLKYAKAWKRRRDF
jgi:hypothetical protein